MIRNHMLYDITLYDMLYETSLSCMHYESDSNYSLEFRFVSSALQVGRNTRESLVEIPRGDEGLKRGL